MKCSVFIAMSVDGYIARRDGSIDWLSAVEQRGEDYGFNAFLQSIDALVMGSKTYETALSFASWPYAEKRCFVLTHQQRNARYNETFFKGEPGALVKQLAAEGLRRIYVDGGHVIRSFLQTGLLTDMTLSVIPILLGSGIRLFDDGLEEKTLVLEESHSYRSGLMQMRYRIL